MSEYNDIKIDLNDGSVRGCVKVMILLEEMRGILFFLHNMYGDMTPDLNEDDIEMLVFREGVHALAVKMCEAKELLIITPDGVLKEDVEKTYKNLSEQIFNIKEVPIEKYKIKRYEEIMKEKEDNVEH